MTYDPSDYDDYGDIHAEFGEYGTYELQDDLYQLNLAEADDYRDDFDEDLWDEDLDPFEGLI